MAFDEESPELVDSNRFLVRKIGFVFSAGKSGYNDVVDLRICNKKMYIRGRITLAHKGSEVLISFSRKTRLPRVTEVEENLEVTEDQELFGYKYDIKIPKNNIIILK